MTDKRQKVSYQLQSAQSQRLTMMIY